MGRPRNDITGQRFGKYSVLEYVGRINGRSLYKCRCDCGTEKILDRGNLVRGNCKSCRCEPKNLNPYKKHGMWNSRIYKCWENMKSRCRAKEGYPYYKNYAGRGIGYCKEWEKFEPFMEWAMSNGYQDNLELDRIDNDCSYSPANCRWVTKRQNTNNRRKTIKVTIDGTTKALAEWCDVYGIKLQTVYGRIKKLGWDPERAIMEPNHNKTKMEGKYETKVS